MQAAGEISEAIQQQLQAHAACKCQTPAAGPLHAVAPVPRFAWAATPTLPSDSQWAPPVGQVGPLLQPQPAGQAEGRLLDAWQQHQQPAQPHLGRQGMQAQAAGPGHSLPPSSGPWQGPIAEAAGGAPGCTQPDHCPPADMPLPDPQARYPSQLPWPNNKGTGLPWPAFLPPQAPQLRGLGPPITSQAAGEWHQHQEQQGQGGPGVGPSGSYPWRSAQQQQRGAQPGTQGAVPQLAGLPVSADQQSAWLQRGLTGHPALQQAGASGAPEGAGRPGSQQPHLVREGPLVAGLCRSSSMPTGARLHALRQVCSSSEQAMVADLQHSQCFCLLTSFKCASILSSVRVPARPPLLPCRAAADADMSRIQDSGDGLQRVAAQLDRPPPAAPADTAAGELQDFSFVMHCSHAWHLQPLCTCLWSPAWLPAGPQAAAAQQHISETPSDGGPVGSAAHLASQMAAPAQRLLPRDAHLDCESAPASPSALGQPQSDHRTFHRPGPGGAAPAGSLGRPGEEGVRPVPETPDGAEDRSQPAETPEGDSLVGHAAGSCMLCLPGDCSS